MKPTITNMLELLEQWERYGYVQLPSIIPSVTLAALRGQLAQELKLQGLDPSNPATFPASLNKRRVFEVAPVGAGMEAWGTLMTLPPLRAALDALLGECKWSLEANQEGVKEGSTTHPRHWYCPCTTPEFPGAVEDIMQPAAAPKGDTCKDPRPCPFFPCTQFQLGGTSPQVEKEGTWAPVSRRRFIGMGWHLDVGPGVPAELPRALTGDAHRAGAVVLVALNDWGPGEGGTAFLPGSHRWIEKELRDRSDKGLPPPSHQELNLFAANGMRGLTESGRVLLPSCGCGAALVGTPHAPLTCTFGALVRKSCEVGLGGDGSVSPLHECGEVLPPPALVQQVVCKEGSVFLFHPFLIHTGTLNLGKDCRLLLNGMARVVSPVE